MSLSKTIYLLIGPKGSGKSFIGMLFERHFGIPFIRVEDWVRTLRQERSIDDQAYLQEVFTHIEEGLIKTLEDLECLVFESTGLTPYFDQMLTRLELHYRVVTIGVSASPELCLARVKSRDQSIHINVSDEEVLEINRRVLEKSRNVDYSIENIDKTAEALVEEIGRILI